MGGREGYIRDKTGNLVYRCQMFSAYPERMLPRLTNHGVVFRSWAAGHWILSELASEEKVGTDRCPDIIVRNSRNNQ